MIINIYIAHFFEITQSENFSTIRYESNYRQLDMSLYMTYVYLILLCILFLFANYNVTTNYV